jgi:hypothetical protein
VFTVTELKQLATSANISVDNFFTFLTSLNDQGFLLKKGKQLYQLMSVDYWRQNGEYSNSFRSSQLQLLLLSSFHLQHNNIRTYKIRINGIPILKSRACATGGEFIYNSYVVVIALAFHPEDPSSIPGGSKKLYHANDWFRDWLLRGPLSLVRKMSSFV